MNAASGRMTVISGSIRAQVAPMESTPVSGVEIKNDVVAPRLAPDLRSWVAVGITEHEQSGMGTPMSAAVATERVSSPPRRRATHRVGTKTARKPAIAKPTRRYGPDSARTIQIASNHSVSICVMGAPRYGGQMPP